MFVLLKSEYHSMKTLNTFCKNFQWNIIGSVHNLILEHIQKPQMWAFFGLVPIHTGKLESDLLHRSCMSVENKSGVPSEPADYSGNFQSAFLLKRLLNHQLCHCIRNSESHNSIKYLVNEKRKGICSRYGWNDLTQFAYSTTPLV